jgi:multiple sugar transport system permease protein
LTTAPVSRAVLAPAPLRLVAALERARWRWLFGYLLLLPAVVLTLFIIVYPLALAVDLSFQKVRIMRVDGPRLPWTLDNYGRLLASSDFWDACFVSVALVVIVTLACFVVGMATALLVNNAFRGKTVARLLVALPWAIPEVVAAATWTWLFDGSFGLINWLLMQLRIVAHPIAWLAEPHTAFAVITVVLTWTTYPFVSVMLLAGMQAIPRELSEAARVDGAGAGDRFRFVTLPCLRPIYGVALVLVVLKIFREFTTIYVMTGGGPIGATRSLAVYTYEQAFGFYNIGYAAAIGLVTLLFCVVVSTSMVRRASEGPL